MAYYIEYGEYLSMGGICDLTVFQRNIDRACAVIDSYTYDRIANMTSIPLKVKALCRDLIEYYATNANVSEKNIASWSESAGAVSESITYTSQGTEDVEKYVRNLVFEYLWNLVDDNGTPVLYKGAQK